MRRRRVLVAVSTAQLAAGVAGQLLALKRRLPFDVALLNWRGRPDRVPTDSWLIGTALSPPVVMLAAQAVATARLATDDSPAAVRTLGALGAAMTAGYLVERDARAALRPARWDPAVTPVVIIGTGLAFAMARLGLGARSGLGAAPSPWSGGSSGSVSLSRAGSVGLRCLP